MTDHLRTWHRGDPADIIEADPASVKVELRRRFARSVPTWHVDAACRGTDTALFFPVRGQNGRRALEICGQCSVRQLCLDEAMSDPDLDVGVRGGMTGGARQARRRLLAKGGAS